MSPKYTLSLWICCCTLFISCSANQPSEERSDYPEADSLIQAALSEDLFTGAVLLIAESGEIVHHKAYGYATLYDESLRVVPSPDSTTTRHLFDLASLTKVFATTYAFMALHTDGKINPDAPVSQYLPDFNTPQHRTITVRQLLNHTSGLMPWYPLYYRAAGSDDLIKEILSLPLSGVPGEARRYSDLGFIVLAEIAESITGMSFDEYLYDRVYSRIGLEKTVYNPLDKGMEDLVSTSHGNPFERKMVYEPDFGYRIDVDPDSWRNWRTYTLRGEVSDGNAWHAAGGMAGHAGLFSTAEDLLLLLQAVINPVSGSNDPIFEEETIRMFTEPDEFGNGLGWAMEPSALHAETLPQGAIGHTGFTGTNFVADPNPDGGRIYILLTNRQHVGVDGAGLYPDLRELREKMAKLVFGEQLR
ncbi:serine hydrolase domain-containing protein [Rhodohalobacter mucosus]|uniref:Beta-lactamase-related domain-containing protein n=1 Tax=Rhodohalobacter mucosus TaxID=2079485 RepID=A0A316TTL5_9BACT|nr:serine hydrolase [Rhodohalobacter mucosus]PWN05624.1 hypothetical protein DDZ15_13585 [Rhodohalobacter mucosus]